MEISINIKFPEGHLFGPLENCTVDFSVRDMDLSQANRLADLRPVIASHIYAMLPETLRSDEMKRHIASVIYAGCGKSVHADEWAQLTSSPCLDEA